MEQKDYWDSVSDTKHFTTPFHAAEFAGLVRREENILDVGCGYGRTLDELHHLGYTHLTGIDFSKGMIERGRSLYPYLNLYVKENSTIDFPDESFDAVILFAVLTCIISNEEQKSLIREIHRILKPSGILYVNDFLLNTDWRNLTRYERYKEKYGIYGAFELPEGAILRHHDKAWISSLLSGFETIDFQSLTFTTMNGHTSNGFYFLGRR